MQLTPLKFTTSFYVGDDMRADMIFIFFMTKEERKNYNKNAMHF